MRHKSYIINGDPIALARPRFGKDNVYDSQKREKLIVGIDLRNQHEGEDPYDGPIHMEITFFMPMPNSWSDKKKRDTLGTYHHLRPDIDNLVKFILDSANAVLFKDDAIVASINTHKVYSSKPHTKITIRELDDTTSCLC